MIIDVTSYLGKWPYWYNPYTGEEGDKLIKLMDKSKIDKSIIISLKSIFYDDKEGNELTFLAEKKYPDRFFVSITINPNNLSDPISYINECIEKGAKIIRLYPHYHGYKLSADNYKLTRIVNFLSNYNYPISISMRLLMNWGFYSLPVEDVIAFVREFPKGVFLIDGFNYSEFNSLLEFAKVFKNVFFISTCLTMYRGIEEIVTQLGTERLLCGTGSPLQSPTCSLVTIQNSSIIKNEKEKIFGFNARKILKLS